MSGWSLRSCGIVASLGAAVGLAACGSGASQDAGEPNGNFPVQASAHWTSSQHLAQHTQLVITTTNMGSKTIPNIAVTITDGNPSDRYLGTRALAFQELLSMSGLASRSRPVWVVDQGPGLSTVPCPKLDRYGNPSGPYNGNYSQCVGGPGGAVTAYSNTWALGSLAPGKSVTFAWQLTAVQPGVHYVYWRVAAGLNGKAKAVSAGGGAPRGAFTINISKSPAQAYVNNNGQIVTTP